MGVRAGGGFRVPGQGSNLLFEYRGSGVAEPEAQRHCLLVSREPTIHSGPVRHIRE